MSRSPAVPAPPPIDSYANRDRGSLERKRRHAGNEDYSTADDRESLRPRPLSWHPSAPVEPPLDTSHHRSIGVSSILNHPSTDRPLRTSSVDPGREALREQLPLESPTHSLFPSSSTVHLPSPSAHSVKPQAMSPSMGSHQGSAPVSPSARFASAGGYSPQKAALGHSALAQPLPALQTVAPSPPLTISTSAGHHTPMPSHHHQTSTHPASTFGAQRPSTNPTPTPSSKEPSPAVGVSMFSQLGRSSPGIASAHQSAPPHTSPPPYAGVDPVTRFPTVLPGHRRSAEDIPHMNAAHSEAPPGMIPVVYDYKSGSSAQAQKRKNNSDASRRFRNKKKNQKPLEETISAQQSEIQQQAKTIQRQAEELRLIREQRDFYRSERDYFREQLSHFLPSHQLPTRPVSPRDGTLASERGSQATWTETDAPTKTEEAAPGAVQKGVQHLASASAERSGTWSATSGYSNSQA
ncbi:hypothetical protein BJX61DRAFT_126068 [Aspergillus egyptiacus]|nr:hypothetical protein BJX61DRAFT_126068 [Aspergillus egyptiacus]